MIASVEERPDFGRNFCRPIFKSSSVLGARDSLVMIFFFFYESLRVADFIVYSSSLE